MVIKNKRGYFFSLDAFIALVIILGVIFFIKPETTQIVQEVNVQQDLLDVLSNLQVKDFDDPIKRIKQLIHLKSPGQRQRPM